MSTSEENLHRRVRFLTAYSIVISIVLGAAAATLLSGRRSRFGEIDVERINIVEPDGKLRLVVSNRTRSTGPLYKGKPFGYSGGGRPGMIFFNDEGTENGGLTFSGSTTSSGQIDAKTQLSFDQFNQDQVLVLSYGDRRGRRSVGMSVNDRADVDIFDLVAARDSLAKIKNIEERNAALARFLSEPRDGVPLMAQRLFIGRSQEKAAILDLRDRAGVSRLRILVDSLGSPRIEFLDVGGNVVRSIGANEYLGG